MQTFLVLLATWVLINVLFVLIVVPPRKPRSGSTTPGSTLSPAPIDKTAGHVEHDEPLSLRHVVASVVMGVFFVFVPPLIAALHAIERGARQLWGKSKAAPGE